MARVDPAPCTGANPDKAGLMVEAAINKIACLPYSDTDARFEREVQSIVGTLSENLPVGARPTSTRRLLMTRTLPMIIPQPTVDRRTTKPTGQKAPLQPKEVWAIRVRLQLAQRIRDLALFNLAIDAKLRGCDLVCLKVADVAQMGEARSRASVIQKKTGAPVRFEITPVTREALNIWLKHTELSGRDWLFPSRVRACPHLTTRQYQRLVKDWVTSIGLDPSRYGSHSLRRTKATQIYKRTGNLRAVQLLLGHAKIESTVQYLGVEVEDALTISEQLEL
jgi:integrase